MADRPTPPPPSLGTRHGRRAVVCTTDHLASGAGLAVLRAGGTAADAAIAAAAVLSVTQPYQCGPGGDLFALVHDGDGTPRALDASGRAGAGADPDRLRAEGHRRMPFRGDVRTVTVPGCVDGWIALHERYGRLPLGEVLAPAVELALHGFPAGPYLVALAPMLDEVEGAEPFTALAGRPPGSLVRLPRLARTLDAIGAGGRQAFYGGPFGEALLRLGDGQFEPADLHASQADWVDPISVEAWGHRIWTVPAASQGYLALLAAAIAEQVGLPDDGRSAPWAHLTVECARVAGHDRPTVLHEGADLAPLLRPHEVRRRADLVDPEQASSLPAPSAAGDTVYLCVVDEQRLAVSLIQSNASAFGAHLVAGGTGVFLHNRGLGFSLEPGHPAELGPGRRPPHTLAPLLVTTPAGAPRLVLGTMGGDAQPQVLLQLLARSLQLGQDPGQVLRAPRWALSSGTAVGFDTWDAPASQVQVGVEANAPGAWAEGLAARGHEVASRPAWDSGCGMAHLIAISDDQEVLGGASDPRAPEAAALAW